MNSEDIQIGVSGSTHDSADVGIGFFLHCTDPHVPPSTRKLGANRKNAQKSTGPQTSAGKKKVRFNAVKHGLLAQHLAELRPEAMPKFRRLLGKLREHYKPQGELEEHWWRELPWGS